MKTIEKDGIKLTRKKAKSLFNAGDSFILANHSLYKLTYHATNEYSLDLLYTDNDLLSIIPVAMNYHKLPDALQRIAWDCLCEKEPVLDGDAVVMG
jgi:hypothetical protein